MKHLDIGNIRIPAFENIKLNSEIELTRFRLAVLAILGTCAVVLYIITKQNEKKIKEIIKGRSVDV
jgi:hypothetical protein